MDENNATLNEHIKNHFEHNGIGDKKYMNKYEHEAEFSHVQERMAVNFLFIVRKTNFIICK
jgi:hypothetical protein